MRPILLLLGHYCASSAGLLLIGGGDVADNGIVTTTTLAQLAYLRSLGANSSRTALYPPAFIADGSDWQTPTPQVLDNLLAATLAHNITPTLTFEFNCSAATSTGFGNSSQWTAIGRAFMLYAGPGGAWGSRVGAPHDFGITRFAAFSTADADDSCFLASNNNNESYPGPQRYVAALAGLASGVQQAARGLGIDSAITPGGFVSMNWEPGRPADPTLRGFGGLLAPLWQNGSLSGLDLHVFFDEASAPVNGTHAFSAQARYEAVVKASGITRPLPFFCSAVNFRLGTNSSLNDSVAAQWLLTALWDVAGVTYRSSSDGSATALALPWSVFHTLAEDPAYGMAVSADPYTPSARGATFQALLRVLGASGSNAGWEFQELDPDDSGVFVLAPVVTAAVSSYAAASAPAAAPVCRKLVVWQDVLGWTSGAAREFIVRVPTNQAGVCTSVRVISWDGVRKVVPIPPGAASVLIPVPGGETYMFLATDGADGLVDE